MEPVFFSTAGPLFLLFKKNRLMLILPSPAGNHALLNKEEKEPGSRNRPGRSLGPKGRWPAAAN
jgi:hypothetical protein